MITRLNVRKLFGLYSYNLDFRCGSGDAVTIITGPNGYGKTSVLRLINALYTRDYKILFDIPFDDIEYYFDGKVLKLTRLIDTDTLSDTSDLQHIKSGKLCFEFYTEGRDVSDFNFEVDLGDKFSKDGIDPFNLFMNSRGCYFITDDRLVSYKTDVSDETLALEGDLLIKDVTKFKTLLGDIRYDAKNEQNLDVVFKEKLDLFRSIIDSCHFADKTMQIDRINGIRFKSDNELGQFVDIEKLSSGEKHILIQMLELIFFAQEGMVALVDEPELSFHPAWLSQYIGYIDKIQRLKSTTDSKFQVIVATHSPQLVGQRWSSCVDLYKWRRDE